MISHPRLHAFFGVGVLLIVAIAADDPASAPVYELRIYHCNEGKLPALHARFRDHTAKLFDKHGMKNVAYFTPQDEVNGKQVTLVYVLQHANRDAAKASWAAFGADPEWQKVRAASEKDGVPLVKKVDAIYLDATPYSPNPLGLEPAPEPRVFEMRTYKASPGKLENLHKRFHDHTLKLFEKHGMTNVVCGVPQDVEKGKGETLIYFLAFPSRDQATKSWKAFVDDPEWQKVFKESQPDGVELAAKIDSLFLEPTDYSPIR